MVTTTTNSVGSLSDLKYFVYQTLCRDHELLLNEFPTTETILKRGNSDPCGMMFCLHGPREVKISAIWERRTNRVLFYGPNGKRYQQVELQNGNIALDDASLNTN